MLRVAVTGAKGKLGSALVGMGCVPIGADITDPTAVRKELDEVEPDVLINCAAVTDVDGCEKPDINKRAIAVNTRGVAILRESFDGTLIHISTDYIFDGTSGPYSENAKANPISAYGFSKYGGEAYLLTVNKADTVIVRTTMLYGGEKPDFVSKILDQIRWGMDFEVTKRVSGSPTYVPHLAESLLALVNLPSIPRIVHIAGKDVMSRYEFAQMIADVFGWNRNLIHPLNGIVGVAMRPQKAGLKVKLAERLGLPLYSAKEGLIALRESMGVLAE